MVRPLVRLMLRMLLRDARAGELTVLALALAAAVASLSSVGFLADRVASALVLQSHQLLGGDLLLSSDHPWPAAIRERARRDGLALVDSASFPSMVSTAAGSQLAELQAMLDQLADAVQVVFGFALLAGLAVLYAAMQASQDERRLELALLRALGARTRQLRGGVLAEFALLGGIAGLLGGVGAAGLAWALARQVFHLDYRPDPWLPLLGLAAGAIGAALAGWAGSAGVLKRPALGALRGE